MLIRTPSLNYNPNLFIDELLQIIKVVFVRKGNVLNKLLNLDRANQLEQMRRDVEEEAVKRYTADIALNKKMIDYFNKKEIELNIAGSNINKLHSSALKKPENETVYDMSVAIIGFRNIMLPQLEDEAIQLSVVFECDEEFQTQIFELSVPTDNDQAMMQYLPQDLVLQTLVMGSNLTKKLKIRVIQRADGIHQHDMGSGQIYISLCISSSVGQYFSVKLFGNQDCTNAYIDLKIQMNLRAEKRQFQFALQGFKKPESDILNIQKDEEISKLIQPNAIKAIAKLLLSQTSSKSMDDRVIRQFLIYEPQIQGIMNYTNDASKNMISENMQQLQNIVPAIPTLLQELGLVKDLGSDLTSLLTRITLFGQKLPLHLVVRTLYTLFAQNGQLMQNTHDVKRLLIHLFRVFIYPIPDNEIWNMTQSDGSKYSNVQIFKVSQQMIKEENSSINFFNKIVSGLTTQEKTMFNITDVFRQTLNQVMRLTGLIHQIPMSAEPFNNINFWLRSNNELKKHAQLISVTLIDQNGDHHMYKFKFNAQGLFEATPANRNILPLVIGGCATVTKDTFSSAIFNNSMLSDFIRHEFFLNSQLHGTNDIYVDSNSDYQITLMSVGKIFIFGFTHDMDKQDDFTVDPSQLMRIAKGDVSQIYKKSKNQQDGSIIIQVNLSSLSRQDTFIWIKERMRMVLDFISSSENISDTPNLMSTKFQFSNNKGGYFSSMDRLMDVTTERETQFELVRVGGVDQDQDGIPLYDSYGLYIHSDSTKEWRPCRIVLKNQPKQGYGSAYRIAFQHEPDQTYTLRREDILLSYQYKRTQEGYYKEEIQEFLDKLDKEEVQIAEVLKEQDRRGMQGVGTIEEVKRKLHYDGDEGLKIANQDLDDQVDLEDIEIKEKLSESYVVNSYYDSGN